MAIRERLRYLSQALINRNQWNHTANSEFNVIQDRGLKSYHSVFTVSFEGELGTIKGVIEPKRSGDLQVKIKREKKGYYNNYQHTITWELLKTTVCGEIIKKIAGLPTHTH